MRGRFRGGWTGAIAILASFTWAGAAHAQLADTIYAGGNIVTMDDARPNAEAMAVKDGKILAVGSRAEVEKAHKGPGTTTVDLAGKTLLPGFLDAHSHYFSSLTVANQVKVYAPPAGPGKDVPSIVAELVKHRDARKVPAGQIIQAYGYDENVMPEGRLLNRDDLDAAFPDNPVIVGHVSMHGAVMNSAALRKYGITAETKTPPGGVIVRKPGTDEPWGLIMETAYLPVFAALPKPTREEEVAWSRAGQMLYAQAGVTTAHEGATHANEVEIMKRATAGGANIIDVVAYPFITDLDEVLKANPVGTWGRYDRHFKIGGVKITIDGSPQGKTAYFTTPYLTGGPGGETNWRGELTFPEATVNQMVKRVYDLGVPLILHCNGDGAIDTFLTAYEAARAGDFSRPWNVTTIHSQFMRKDQIPKFVKYKVRPSFYTLHTYYFAEAHIANRGREQAMYISPMRDAIAAGLRPTNHTDFVVAPLDQMFMLWSAVNRISRAGAEIGPDQRVSPPEGLKAMTIWAAEQYGEEASKGSLEPGKLADLVILSDNPLTIDPMKIKDIQVLETIKEGKTVYRRGAEAAAVGAPAARRGDDRGGAATTPTLQDFAGQLAGRGGPATIHVARSFLTMDPKTPRAEAIAVRDGKFIAVGTRAECEAAAGRDAKVDSTFKDKVVVAGFVEQHVHPVLAALTMNTKVISIEDWDAIDGFSAAVRDETTYRGRLGQALAAHADKGKPFITWGYHHYFHGAMSRAILDKLAPDFPVVVWHRSCHEFYLNSAALRSIGIDAAFVDGLTPSQREQASFEEGHFFEQGALAILGKLAPILASPEQFRRGLEFTEAYYHRAGITTACEPGGFFSKPMQDAINAVYSDDATPFNHGFIADGKTFAARKPGDPRALIADTEQVLSWGKGRTFFLPKQVKLLADGAIYSQLMQMKDGYTDGHHGAWIMDPPVFDYAFQGYWDAGYQIHIHNNGDAGLDVVLGSLEKAMQRNPRTDHRTVLVHFGFATPEQVRRWAELGGIVSSNPYYVTALAGRYAKLGIGPERSRNMVPMGAVVKSGVSFSFHSDMPMAPAKPLQLVWAAVNRLTAEGEVAGPEHRVTVDQALKAVTLDAAYSIRLEGRVGSITVGKDANLTVLEQDPYEVEPGKLKDIAVWGTMLEGRVQPVAAATRAAAAPRGGGSGLTNTASDERLRRAVIEQLARLVGHTCAD